MEQSSLGNILGQNVNYNVNIKIQQNNSNSQVTQLEETQNVENILKNLKAGQSFSGQITDIRGNILQISINNQNILAQLTDSFTFHIGQEATFIVKENNGTQLLIKPADNMFMQNMGNIVIEQALEAAGFPTTEKNLELVKNLILNQQPIDKQTLSQYMKIMFRFPDTDINTLIALKKNGLPITAENIQNLENYQSYESEFTQEIGNLSKDLGEFIGQLANEQGTEKVTQFLNKLWDTFELTNAQQEIISKEMPEHKIENPLLPEEQNEILTWTKSMGLEKEGKDIIQNKESSPENILNHLKSMLEEKEISSEDVLKLVKTEGFQKLLKTTIENKMLLKPEDLQREGAVKEYYRKTGEKAEKLQQILHEFGKEESTLTKTVENMNKNLKMMNAVNEFVNYVQLPLKLINQNTQGDLYVYTKKKNLGKNGEELTAMLHLDMEYLGSIDVMVKMKEKKVSTNFILETEELLDFIEEHIDLLNQRLEEKGYSVSSTVKKKETEEIEKIEIEEIEKEKKKFEAKQPMGEWQKQRFSFDMRI